MDAGQALSPPTGVPVPEVDLPVLRAKASLIADAWMLMGMDAVALGHEDWALGTAFVQGLVVAHKLPVLAANLTCDGVAPYPASRVVEVAGVRVGLVGVTEGPVPGCEVSDPEAALKAAREALGPVGLSVALIPQGGPTGKVLAKSELGFDVVLNATGMSSTPADLAGGPGAVVLGAGSRGKQLGVLEVVPGADFAAATAWAVAGNEAAARAELGRLEAGRARVQARRELSGEPDAQRRFDAQLTSYDERIAAAKLRVEGKAAGPVRGELKLVSMDLGEDVPDHAETAAKVAAYKAGLGALSEAKTPAEVRALPRRAPDGPYVGADACAGCHQAESAQWAGTAHARAWEGLVAVGSAADPSCFACHVTGAGTEGGAASASELRGLHGVQCETCHGPASKHITAPKEHPLTRRPDEATCRGCHDGDRDGGRFDPAVYWPKVMHGLP